MDTRRGRKQDTMGCYGMEVGDDSANEGSNEMVKGVRDDSFETIV